MKEYNVYDYGAAGDGVQKDTAAIQKAIDACSADGGGKVAFPKGKYLTGTIHVRDFVTLSFSPSAVLLGSTDIDDYNRPGVDNIHEMRDAHGLSIIYAENAENIGIEGFGEICGQGATFPCGTESYSVEDKEFAPVNQRFLRPVLLRFRYCKRVRFRDILFTASASHGVHINWCKDVLADGVRIFNRANQNNDGFHIVASEDVRISNCNLSCGDDAIAISGGADRFAITNCIISSRWAAIRTMGASEGALRNIAISNCVIYDTYGCAVKLQSSSGGIMENISVDNIALENVTGPISLRLGTHFGFSPGRVEPYPIGIMRNISFSNIIGTVAGYPDPLPHEVAPFPGERRSCINLSGVEGHMIKNVSFTNINLVFPGGGTAEEAERTDVPELRDRYPEYFMFGILPAYGFYARHVEELSLDKIKLTLLSKDMRAAIFCDDVENLEIFRLTADSHARQDNLLRFRNTRNAHIDASLAAPGA